MNEWEIAAAVLGLALIPCWCGRARVGPPHGLAALEVAGVLLSTILMLLSEGFHRQPFIDLAVVFAPMSLVGSLAVRAADGARTCELARGGRGRPADRRRALELLAVLGMCVMRNVYDRLHYVGLAGFGALLIGVAILVRESFSLIGDKALLVGVVLVVAGPVLVQTHRSQPADPRARGLARARRGGPGPVTLLQIVALAAVALAGGGVVLRADPLRQTLVLGIYGLALTMLFFVFQAPDVALSEIVVSTVGLPVMILLALRKVHQHERRSAEHEREEQGR